MGVILCYLLRQTSLQMDSALANFGRGETPLAGGSEGHSPLTPMKSSPIRKGRDSVFLSSTFGLGEPWPIHTIGDVQARRLRKDETCYVS
jgi:hypothetical protein